MIATKVGFLGAKIVDGEYAAVLPPAHVVASCEASLQRLGVECIDLYYQHGDDKKTPLAHSLGAFEELRRAGKIRSVGLSNFSAERLTEAVATSAREGFEAPSTLQCEYNMIARNRFEGPLRDAAVAAGMAVCPYYSLANGFLAGKYRSVADLGKSVRGNRSSGLIDSARGQAVLAALDDIAAATGAALATIALAWTMRQPAITASIASATNLAQAKELVAALQLDLTAEQIEQLDGASA